MDDPMNDDAPRSEADLARLADGRRDEQARAVSLVRRTDDIVAPSSLRIRVAELTGVPDAGGRWRRRLYMPVATVLAVAVAAIVVAVSHPGAPTVAQAARLALARATSPAPATAATDHDLLDLSAAGIRFPAYGHRAGWTATGARRDTLHGRRVTTVFYRAADGTRVGYAIVSGRSLPDPSGPATTIDGVRYVFAGVGSGQLVSWWQNGHTCVIAGRSVGDGTLLALATAEQRSA